MPAAEIAAAQLISLCIKNKAGLPNKITSILKMEKYINGNVSWFLPISVMILYDAYKS
jgi:hypothetical protein